MPTIGTVLSPLYPVKDALESTTNGNFCSFVDFSDIRLTRDELSYCKLVARTNFHQLVIMASYINSGLSFKDSVIKYLKKL